MFLSSRTRVKNVAANR